MMWVDEPLHLRRTGRTTSAMRYLQGKAEATGKLAIYVAGTSRHAKTMPEHKGVRVISFDTDPDAIRGLAICDFGVDHSVAPTTQKDQYLLEILRSQVR